ncbi:type 1 glutamine amidotransferase [Paenibacillus sp. V4I3]|uniref:GMC oxidoreductase n=1 Tax=unclassified Paenibacillus TaxID=185978 RepID=UPI002784C690|nr:MULTISPECIES: GMC oxidoreductase [unclassified Paenibacillus]MDQ0877363.1 type 1 glutamine amidotransferase [Paenibacillus sp. V4I3]MDQ0886772.1 type 1 glutamine amidotransferase [Paenibacillus sp. V4I9]
MSENQRSLKSFHIVFIAAEVEYDSEHSLSEIAREAQRLGARTTLLTAYPSPANPANIPGLEVLADADLAVFFIRYRTLPEEQFRHIRDYIERGKPIIGFRTSTHGFLYPKGHPLEIWNKKFGIDVLGAPWIKHYAYTSGTDVFVEPGARLDPILNGVPDKFHVRSWLYVVLPYPPKGSKILLWGQSVDPEFKPEPGAEINPVAWTWSNYAGGRTFMTTMGHPEDFQVPAFRKLVMNAIYWALGVNPSLDRTELQGRVPIQSGSDARPPASLPKKVPWIPLTPAEKMAQTDYDVLIVGSGAGGGAALWRLCEQSKKSGLRIGMIEAGDLLLPTHAHNLPTFDQTRFDQYIESPPYVEPVGNLWPDYPGARIFRALGGRTLHWYLMSPRFRPEEFINWPISYQELLPYYLIAEQIMNVTGQYTEGSALQETLLHRLRFGGFSDATSIPLAVDLNVTRYGQVHSNVFFSSIIFLAYALNKRPFDLAVNTRAVQVLTESGRAAGVKVVTSDYQAYTIKAKTVILSASTFETPRILLNSHIPGEAIGKYLVNHPSVLAYSKINRNQFPEVLGNAAIMVPSSVERKHTFFILGTDPVNYWWYHYEERKLLDELRFRMLGLTTMEPRVDNHVSLDLSKLDSYGMPLLKVQFSYSTQDQAKIRELTTTIHAAAKATGLEFYENPCLLPPGLDNHEAGTCRMGDDPATSATNRYGQIHGVPGLYVADNSVLSLTGAANPTLTTVALAIRTADYILGQT